MKVLFWVVIIVVALYLFQKAMSKLDFIGDGFSGVGRAINQRVLNSADHELGQKIANSVVTYESPVPPQQIRDAVLARLAAPTQRPKAKPGVYLAYDEAEDGGGYTLAYAFSSALGESLAGESWRLVVHIGYESGFVQLVDAMTDGGIIVRLTELYHTQQDVIDAIRSVSPNAVISGIEQ